MQTDNANHTPAQVMMATGVERPGRPSMGACKLWSGHRELRPARLRGHVQREITIPISPEARGFFAIRPPSGEFPLGKGSRVLPFQPRGYVGR